MGKGEFFRLKTGLAVRSAGASCTRNLLQFSDLRIKVMLAVSTLVSPVNFCKKMLNHNQNLFTIILLLFLLVWLARKSDAFN